MFLVKFFSEPTPTLVVGASIAVTSVAVFALSLNHVRNKMTRAQRKEATRKANAAKAENKETKDQEIKDNLNFNQDMDAIRKKERDDEKEGFEGDTFCLVRKCS